MPLAELLLCAQPLDLSHMVLFKPHDPKKWVLSSFRVRCFERGWLALGLYTNK